MYNVLIRNAGGREKEGKMQLACRRQGMQNAGMQNVGCRNAE
jgi:hypothetical protein